MGTFTGKIKMITKLKNKYLKIKPMLRFGIIMSLIFLYGILCEEFNTGALLLIELIPWILLCFIITWETHNELLQ